MARSDLNLNVSGTVIHNSRRKLWKTMARYSEEKKASILVKPTLM